MEIELNQMKTEDWPQVRVIYQEGIEGGMSTFETEAPGWERWDAGHLPACRLVARVGDAVVGWAALIPVSSRRAYAGVAEVSIYIAGAYRGQGVGKRLLAELISQSEQAGLWTLQATIFAKNQASIHLHKHFGFREIGYRERISKDRFGQWQNTVVLERRSQTTGVD